MRTPTITAGTGTPDSDPGWRTQFGSGADPAPSDDAPAEATHAQASALAFHPPPSADERLARVLKARNPFLEAANYLLRALADIPRLTLDAPGVEGLRLLLEEEVRTFTRLCDRANLRREHMLATRYALCTALDEAANLTPWGGGQGKDTGPWPARALLQTFHQEGYGGNTVFLLIGRLAAEPREHLAVLEIMLHVLGLGFEGHYRTRSDGSRVIESIRNRLYGIVADAGDPVARELSPHWRGVGAGKLRLLRSLPVWVTASVLGLTLAGLFAWYKYHLVGQAELLDKRIRDIGSRIPAQQPAVRQLRLKELLANEIATKRVEVDEDEKRSVVTFKGDDMFPPGRDQVSPNAISMLARVAEGINEVSGAVQVTGHSDSQPIATREFPTNKALSDKRAERVAEALRDAGVDPGRITTVGAGDSQPVADNRTAAGRARNRRVEIVVGSR